MKMELLVWFIKSVNQNLDLEIAQTARQLLRYHSPLKIKGPDGWLHSIFPVLRRGWLICSDNDNFIPSLILDNLDISGISRNKVMLLESGVEIN